MASSKVAMEIFCPVSSVGYNCLPAEQVVAGPTPAVGVLLDILGPVAIGGRIISRRLAATAYRLCEMIRLAVILRLARAFQNGRPDTSVAVLLLFFGFS